jgi:hypothetical protein
MVGLAWYKRADYARILEVMVDRDSLDPTFDKWLRNAKNIERQLKRRGILVVHAYIDPERFVAWCAANGLDANSRARAQWSSEPIHYRAPPT